MIKYFMVAIALLIGHTSYSQQTKQGKVSVIVLNEAGTPLEGATAELLRGKDSAIAKSSITDKSGLAEFQRIAAGSYKVRVTMVNFSSYVSEAFAVNNDVITLPTLSLKVKAGTNLKDVTVTARKPFIQKLIDRIVVNVDNSIVSAGSTALDILERSPGITVDQNDAISLRGRAGVIIMIDGKVSPMTGADLGNYLRNLPSNAIDRIEIITNPSAKYDAAGNSGIIDIRLKKDQRLGTNGTFTTGYGQGVYPKANAGVTL
ncbi:MAG TPA: TonB-dependent receptor, partial [Segetibacter sp.]